MLTDKPGKNNPICQECGLYKGCISPFMKPSGSKEPRVLIVGEAPGEEEDKHGIPFYGRSGVLLRTTVEGVGLQNDEVTYTNVVRCRPPDNKISKNAIKYCKVFALDEIHEYDPEYVLLMGNSPLEGILGEIGITNWHGVIIKKFGRKYMPLYHPAYILRNASVTDEWLTAFLSITEDEKEAHEYELIIPHTQIEVKQMQMHLEEWQHISFDTEVTSLNPFSGHCKLLAVSFAVPGRKYAVPLDHKKSWFRNNVTVKTVIRDILESHTGGVIGQNLKFDQLHARRHLGAYFTGYSDTMLISHMLDSKPGLHGLKRLAGIYCGMYGYEAELDAYVTSHREANPRFGGNYGEIPLEILLPYAAADAEATLKVYDTLYDKLTPKQRNLLKELVMQFSDMLCEIQHNGMVLDKHMTRRYVNLYELFYNDLYTKLIHNKHVKKLLEIHKDKKDFKFNPNSNPQIAELYFDICKIPVAEYTPTGKGSTKATLYKKIEPRFPILYSVRQYKLLGKMLSTYLRPADTGSWLSDDGRVRSTYNLHGTRTSRISSSNPNLQNIPTPEKEPGTLLEYKPIKNIFTHSYVDLAAKNYVDRYCGGVLLSADYSGMELRVFASLARCKPMIEIHESGMDFHTMVASMASGIPYAKIDKPTRYIYKWTNWTLLYGGGVGTLVAMYDMSEDEAKTVVDRYYKQFPEVLEYRQECVEFAEKNGYIESPFGRREGLSEINSQDKQYRSKAAREAINMPVQSAASDLTLCAATIISNQLSGSDAKLVNTVHDSILLDVPRREIDAIADMCIDAMENIKEFKEDYFPSIDFDWLICPLKADIEVGTHYGSEISIEEWEGLYG
jgi:DNA polymerase-1